MGAPWKLQGLYNQIFPLSSEDFCDLYWVEPGSAPSRRRMLHRRGSLSRRFWRQLLEGCSNYNNYKLRPLLKGVGLDSQRA